MNVRLNSDDRTRVRAHPVTYEGKKLNDLKPLIQFNSIQFNKRFLNFTELSLNYKRFLNFAELGFNYKRGRESPWTCALIVRT